MNESHVDRVVETTTLGDRTRDLLMVAGRVDTGNTVDTSWETVGDVCSQNAVFRGIVETLEESEDLGVQGFRRIERRHLLHGNVTVTLNDTVGQLLRGAIVSVGRVSERPGDQVLDLEGDGELGIGGNGIKVLGGVEFGGRLPVTRENDSQTKGRKTYHVFNGRNITHGSRVARTCLDLFTVRKGLADTEVDEVVPEVC